MSNAQLICRVLAIHGPLTKKDIIERMGKCSGHGAKYAYNINAYVSNVGPFTKSAPLSLLNSGHVEVVGRQGSALVYGLTAKGFVLATEGAQ